MKKLSITLVVSFITLSQCLSQVVFNETTNTSGALIFEQFQSETKSSIDKTLYHLLDKPNKPVYSNKTSREQIWLLDSNIIFMNGIGVPPEEEAKLTYSYDENGNLEHELLQWWNYYSDGWGNVYKTSLVYEDDLLKDSIFMLWDYQIMEWKDATKESYAYDDHENRILKENYVFDDEQDDWRLQRKEDYIFDDNNLMSASYTLTPGIDDELDSLSKSYYSYNTSNDIYMIRSWFKDGEEWSEYMNIDFEYNAGNHIWTIWVYWDETNESWLYYWKKLFQYNSNNELIEQTDFEWEEDDWTLIEKRSFAYNDLGLEDTAIHQHWSVDSGKMINIDRTTSTYDENQNMDYQKYDVWESQDAEWTHLRDLYYYWSAIQVSGIRYHKFVDFRAYPNPASDNVTIEYTTTGSENIQVEILNLQGKHLATILNMYQSAAHHKLQWDATTLTAGIYFIQISTPTFHSVQKIQVIR